MQESVIGSIKGWVVALTVGTKPVWVSESDINGVLSGGNSKLKMIRAHIDGICKVFLSSTYDDGTQSYIVEDHLMAIKEILDENS